MKEEGAEMNVKDIVTDIAAKSKTRGKVDGVYFVAVSYTHLTLPTT